MWFNYVTFCLLFLSVSSASRKVEDIDASEFANEIEIWASQNNETKLFKELVTSLRLPSEFQNNDWRTFPEAQSIGICTTCKATVKTFLNLRRKGMSDEKIKNKIINLCTLLNIQTKRVCTGVIELNLHTVLHIVDSRPKLTGETICGVVLESKSCPLTDPEFEWSIDINDDTNIDVPENSKTEELKILQLTDIHYDPLYEPNGNSNCGEPVCCRKGQNATNRGSLAGFWGDYASCDSPWHAVTDALSHISDNHQDINYVYFTGDIIDHGVWETSKEGNTQSLKQVYSELQKTFKNVPVYPIFGNHEPHPLNQFAPKSITQDNLTTNWLYELMANLWIGYNWLPESTRASILEGGYYTFTPRKGFRIIALNTNVCYSYNWWLLYHPRDPDNQLQWLVNTLLDAEKNGEFVHILSHIPINSNNCVKTWRREYLRIINRFSHLIKAEFNGHTHNDQLAIIYNANNGTKNIAWNGGGLTTYSKLNPSYKLYTVYNNNYEVADYENWMYNLNLANKYADQRPKWYKSYTFKSEYGLHDLSATSLSKWLPIAAKDETLMDKYRRNFYKHAEPSLQGNCDLNCKKQFLCNIIVSAESVEFCK